MVRFLVSIGLLASAFSPLTVTMALVVSPFPTAWLNWVLAVVLALPVLLIPLVIRTARKLGPMDFVPAKVRRRDADNLSLISSFILPISLALFAPDPTRTPASVVVLALLIVVYWRAGLQYLNPVLLVFGYHLYSVEQKNGTETFVLTRASFVSQTEGFRAYSIAPHIYVR